MTKRVFNLLFVCMTFYSAQSQQLVDTKYIEEDGILIEKFDSTNTDENRYNRDNRIYTPGKVFTYQYYHKDTIGQHFLIEQSGLKDDQTYDWRFGSYANKDNNAICRITLTIKHGLAPFIEYDPGYNQTVITYDYHRCDGENWNDESTGLIENEMNIWMHPPRVDYFKILELNPFPYIKMPCEVGKEWTWKLQFGDHWSDKRWLLWRGMNENSYTYKITQRVKIDTNMGLLDCYQVEAKAKSNLGTTELISFFSEKFGFVKLDYKNIDGSKTVIELIDVR